jgi:hypothetical protein
LAGIATIVGADAIGSLAIAATVVAASELSIPAVLTAAEPLDYVLGAANGFGMYLIADSCT